jgi:hypothetical protein
LAADLGADLMRRERLRPLRTRQQHGREAGRHKEAHQFAANLLGDVDADDAK